MRLGRYTRITYKTPEPQITTAFIGLDSTKPMLITRRAKRLPDQFLASSQRAKQKLQCNDISCR